MLRLDYSRPSRTRHNNSLSFLQGVSAIEHTFWLELATSATDTPLGWSFESFSSVLRSDMHSQAPTTTAETFFLLRYVTMLALRRSLPTGPLPAAQGFSNRCILSFNRSANVYYRMGVLFVLREHKSGKIALTAGASLVCGRTERYHVRCSWEGLDS